MPMIRVEGEGGTEVIKLSAANLKKIKRLIEKPADVTNNLNFSFLALLDPVNNNQNNTNSSAQVMGL